jgi:hypothetical protein
MTSVRHRQLPQQMWVSWDEGNKDVSGKIEYDVDPDTSNYDSVQESE